MGGRLGAQIQKRKGATPLFLSLFLSYKNKDKKGEIRTITLI